MFFFYISNTFISNTRLKLAKNQANAKRYPETEHLLFENYSHSSSRHHPKIIEVGVVSKKNVYSFI